MKTITVSARTLDEAITKALIGLEITSDNLEYTIVEKGSSGLFGVIGVKPVVITANKKEKIQDTVAIEAEAKKDDNVIVKDDNEQSLEKITGSAEDFLNNIFNIMEIKVSLEVSYNRKDRELAINMLGESMGVLIGKRGQTLDSLQYLVSLVVNKHSVDYVRVKLDTENYRERRKETLETLAKNVAYKVKRTKRAVSLEPMNPYERRVIHSTLQNDKYIVTRSEGQEPFRHIVISLKRENKYQ